MFKATKQCVKYLHIATAKLPRAQGTTMATDLLL